LFREEGSPILLDSRRESFRGPVVPFFHQKNKREKKRGGDTSQIMGTSPEVGEGLGEISNIREVYHPQRKPRGMGEGLSLNRGRRQGPRGEGSKWKGPGKKKDQVQHGSVRRDEDVNKMALSKGGGKGEIIKETKTRKIEWFQGVTQSANRVNLGLQAFLDVKAGNT